ncbi:MAG: inorganic triphosphatase, partial [Rhodospirillales bacterium]|nr:inorganic triphosphatase [Rhodospirillales bacterium]
MAGYAEVTEPPIDQKFRSIVGKNLALLRKHLPAVAEGQPEGVHQARVVLRRLRSAITLFRPALNGAIPRRVEKRLRRVARSLGEARDWDVLLDETLPDLLDEKRRIEIAPLLARAEAARLLARKAAQHAMADKAFVRALPELERAAAEFGDSRPFRAEVGEWLERRWRKLRKQGGKRVGALPPDDLHETRIALKKLHYALDFAAAPAGAQFAASLKKMRSEER